MCCNTALHLPVARLCRVRVASELKEIIQQQQVQLQTANAAAAQGWQSRTAHSPDASGAPFTGSAAGPASGSGVGAASPPLAQLQRLVRDMRAELRQPAASSSGAAAAGAFGAGTGYGVNASGSGGWEQAAAAAARGQQTRAQQQPGADRSAGLQAELESTRRQLLQLQDAYDQLMDSQVRLGICPAVA